MSTLRHLFRYPESLLFFNSGSMSLSPSTIIDAIAREKTKYEDNPTDALFGASIRLWEMQKNLAAFFKVRPQDLYLRQNVTLAMNDFIMALNLPRGSEILYSDMEYGAIVRICNYKAELDGLTTREFSFHPGVDSANVTEDMIVANLEKALKPYTKMVMLSHVMTGAGLRVPLEKIGRMLRAKKIFFVIDGAHGAGSVDLNLNPEFLDYYGFNLHKWMMGPKGTGFAWVAPHMREHLTPRFAGWTTGVVPSYFSGFAEGDEWAIRWMICSTVNFADYLGINEMLRFWNEQGIANLYREQKRVFNRSRDVIQRATGWKCTSEYPESLQGPLIGFEMPDKLAERSDLMAWLFEKRKVVISTPLVPGKPIIRVTPNVYNTDAEIEQLAIELKNLN